VSVFVNYQYATKEGGLCNVHAANTRRSSVHSAIKSPGTTSLRAGELIPDWLLQTSTAPPRAIATSGRDQRVMPHDPIRFAAGIAAPPSSSIRP
jgi:hypothetical protein